MRCGLGVDIPSNHLYQVNPLDALIHALGSDLLAIYDSSRGAVVVPGGISTWREARGTGDDLFAGTGEAPQLGADKSVYFDTTERLLISLPASTFGFQPGQPRWMGIIGCAQNDEATVKQMIYVAADQSLMGVRVYGQEVGLMQLYEWIAYVTGTPGTYYLNPATVAGSIGQRRLIIASFTPLAEAVFQIPDGYASTGAIIAGDVTETTATLSLGDINEGGPTQMKFWTVVFCQGGTEPTVDQMTALRKYATHLGVMF